MYRDLTHGGVQRIMVHIANYFANNGYETTLLLGEAKGPYLSLLDPKVEVLSINSTNRFLLLKYLISVLRFKNPHILFTGVPSFNIMAIIAKYIAGVKTKVVISERSNTFKEFARSTNFFYRLSFLLIPILYRFSDAIVAVSLGVAKDLSRFSFISENRINTIYNPAFNKEIQIEAKKSVEESWLNDKACPVIIGVGRLSAQKDFGMLIDAFYGIYKERQLKLIIVGDGPMHNSLQKKIDEYDLNDSIKLAGFQKNPISWISKSDVFVLSSQWEGFGNILVEALAAGTTIVSTDCKSGPSEILKDGQLGYLVPVSDAEALSKKIIYALDNPFPKDLLVEAAQEFDENIIMKKYEQLFHSMIYSN